MVKNAYIHIVDKTTENEICRYNLTEAAPKVTAIIIGEIFRDKEEWRFSAVNRGYEDGLRPLAIDFGVDVE